MKTTTAHFKLFCDEATYWLRELGVTDWHVVFKHQLCKGEYSNVHYQFTSRKARISLSTSFDQEVTTEKLKESALHEVLHLVFAELTSFAEAAAARHRVIESEHAALHRVLFPLIRARRR